MLRNHLYEKTMQFLTGVGFGIYLYSLRRFYNRIHAPSIDRSATDQGYEKTCDSFGLSASPRGQVATTAGDLERISTSSGRCSRPLR